MLKVDVRMHNARFLRNFSTVGGKLNEKQRVVYMTNACQRQIANLIEEVNLQLKIQGITSDEEQVLQLSSLITEEYPEFSPKLHDCIYDLLGTCDDFLFEKWCSSAIDVGIFAGWFEETSQGINLTPSFSS